MIQLQSWATLGLAVVVLEVLSHSTHLLFNLFRVLLSYCNVRCIRSGWLSSSFCCANFGQKGEVILNLAFCHDGDCLWTRMISWTYLKSGHDKVHSPIESIEKNRLVQTQSSSRQKARSAPPQYSRDLAPCAVFLFGYFKRELRCCFCHTAEEILAEGRKLVDGIWPQTLLAVYREWIARCEHVITSGRTALNERWADDICFEYFCSQGQLLHIGGTLWK
jgi:hypothetical protein